MWAHLRFDEDAMKIAGVTGTAGVKKLCEQGILGKNDTVVSVVTGNGLKDVANAIKAGVQSHYSLPNRATMLERIADMFLDDFIVD